MNCDGKLKLRSHSSSYCLLEVVTKGLGEGGGEGGMVFNSAFINISIIQCIVAVNFIDGGSRST